MPGDVVLMRAWSGPWEHPAERTGATAADVVLYSDGLVTADVSDIANVVRRRAIQLTPTELAEILEELAATDPEPIDQASSMNSGCADADVQVIWVRVDDVPTELAVDCLATTIRPHTPQGAPRAAVALSRMLDRLQQFALDRPRTPTDRPVPVVPTEPFVGG